MKLCHLKNQPMVYFIHCIELILRCYPLPNSNEIQHYVNVEELEWEYLSLHITVTHTVTSKNQMGLGLTFMKNDLGSKEIPK